MNQRHLAVAVGTMVCTMLWVWSACPSFGLTRNVPADYPTIQASINACNPGDVVLVAPNTYHERLNFGGKDITVRSLDPDNPGVVAHTTIDGGHHGSVVVFNHGESHAAVLSGFTITGGTGTSLILPFGFFMVGGGIYCLDASPTITHNVIRDNHLELLTGYGGGIACFRSLALIENNLIIHNAAAGGGGIECTEGHLLLRNNTICDNMALEGSGVRAQNTHVVLVGDIVAFNWPGGGARLHDGTAPSVHFCNVWGNVGGDYVNFGPTSPDNLNVDPLFVDRTSYRLKSVAGHWSGPGAGDFTADTVTSLCLDAGPPTVPCIEPLPNGGRINLGYDANTPQASKTP